MTRRCLAVLVPLLLLGLVAAATTAATPSDTLLRRHAPVLVLDAREPGPPVAVEPFLRGARGAAARAAPARVHGHAVRDGGRVWLQHWLFYPDNPQDRGVVRSGRHEGDWEMLQIGLDAAERPREVTFAQHAWRQGCDWSQIDRTARRPSPISPMARMRRIRAAARTTARGLIPTTRRAATVCACGCP